jgi:hypothetical protein
MPGTTIVVNGSGEYLCTPPGSGHARWASLFRLPAGAKDTGLKTGRK